MTTVTIRKAAHACWVVRVDGVVDGTFRTRANARSYAERYRHPMPAPEMARLCLDHTYLAEPGVGTLISSPALCGVCRAR